MCGQSVHERLTKLGVINKMRTFSEAERAILMEQYAKYADSGRLHELARKMGRTKHYICRQAGLLGLTDWSRVGSFVDPRPLRAWMASHPHPRGMLGKHHNFTDEQVAETTRKHHATKMARYGKLVVNRPTTTSHRADWRVVGDREVFFRSRWEANYGRYLQWLKDGNQLTEWEHEPETFWFKGGKRGDVCAYLPDFRVTALDGGISYHEVKGWMSPRSEASISQMRKHYPTIELVVISETAYKKIETQVSRLIDGWEYRS